MECIGIDHIFDMPGAHILPVYDSLYNSSIKSVLAKHERGVSFMAGGYGCIVSCAQKQVSELSELMNIPVTSSLKGKGGISEHSALSPGNLGVTFYGRAYNYILE